MIKSQLRHRDGGSVECQDQTMLRHGNIVPVSFGSVIAGPDVQFFRIRHSGEGGRYHPASGITARLAEHIHQLQFQTLNAGLLLQLPGGSLLHRLIFIGKSAGQGQLTNKGMALAADQKDLQSPFLANTQISAVRAGLG